jgi:hypothetical protein
MLLRGKLAFIQSGGFLIPLTMVLAHLQMHCLGLGWVATP